MASAILTLAAAVGGIIAISKLMSDEHYETHVSLNCLFHRCDVLECYCEIRVSLNHLFQHCDVLKDYNEIKIKSNYFKLYKSGLISKVGILLSY